MCYFCKPDDFNEEEITREIANKSIDMGEMGDALSLNVWILKDPKSKETKMQSCLTLPIGGFDIATLDIPIKYCPVCGKKL